MKTRSRVALTLVVAVAVASSALAQLDLPRPSPKANVSQVVGLTTISLSYCRPGVKGRVIWGGLVPYDQPWRTGANESTTITFSDPVTINGSALPGGTYALFTIPGKESWTVVFSKDTASWGTNDYKVADDVLRVKATPRQAAAPVEWMTFRFDALATESAEVVLAWEKLEIPFTVKVEVVEKVLAAARKAIAEAKPDDWRTSYRAAAFCLDSKTNLDEAGKWLEQSAKIKLGYYNPLGKARLAALRGNQAEAVTLARKAVELGRAADPKTDVSQAEGFIAEWTK
jgi:hypothetical protein